jgi:hypothetical protein
MSSLFFRYGSRRCLSVWKTKAPSVSSNTQSVTPSTKLSNEKYIKAYERAEDVDQKHVTLPINRDLYPPDTPTHTGQVYDSDDYRNVRFTNKAKLVCLIKQINFNRNFFFLKVNPRFAIDFVRNDPVVVCKARGVWSDSGGPLGHPKVYINLVSYSIEIVFSLSLIKKTNLGQTRCTQLWL